MSKEVKLSNKTVTLREPVVRDLLALDDVSGDANKELHLICSLAQLSLDEVPDMAIKDYKLLQGVVKDFLD